MGCSLKGDENLALPRNSRLIFHNYSTMIRPPLKSLEGAGGTRRPSTTSPTKPLKPTHSLVGRKWMRAPAAHLCPGVSGSSSRPASSIHSPTAFCSLLKTVCQPHVFRQHDSYQGNRGSSIRSLTHATGFPLRRTILFSGITSV